MTSWLTLEWATSLLPPWFLALWAVEQQRNGLLLLGAGLLVALVFRTPAKRTQTAARKDAAEEIKRPTNTSIFRRLWWRLFPPVDLMKVDGLVIDRTRKPHAAWLGPTGAGKSASVATIRVDGKRPTLIVTPDLSDPLIAAVARLGGFRWTACVSKQPVNFLDGTATEVAERLTEVFRSGGVGAWKRAARRVTADVIRDIDAGPEQRNLHLIGQRLEQAVKADRELRTVCAGWVARFLDMADQFGESIGTDGVDIAGLLRQGKTVLMDNDSFDHPSLGGDVVALGLAEGKRCARLVPGGFRLIFEEADQLGERIDLALPFAQAGRRREIVMDVLAHEEDSLPVAINANVSTRVYFAQELKSLQKIAADRLGLDYRELDPANMRDFTAFISHGRIRRLVRFPKPPNGHVSRGETIAREFGREVSVERESRYEVVEVIGLKRERLPKLPPPGILMKKYLDGVYREGGCLRWKGKHDKGGYGYIWLEDEEKSALVHRWRWEQAYGPIGNDPVTGKKLTLDHRRTCFKDCSELTHLERCTRGENSQRRWRVRGVGKGAAVAT